MSEGVSRSRPRVELSDEGWKRSHEEQHLVQVMSDRHDVVSSILQRLATREDTYSFEMANRMPVWSLWNLVLLDDELSDHPPKSLTESAATFHRDLPFSDSELSGLRERMKPYERLPVITSNEWVPDWFRSRDGEDWYRNATPEDVLLVDRWRRFLDAGFSNASGDAVTTEGQVVLADLLAMEKTFNEIL
jgi:hypothetical protein